MVAVLLAASWSAAAQVRVDNGRRHKPPVEILRHYPTPSEIPVSPPPTDTKRSPTRLTTTDRRIDNRQFFLPCCATGAYFGYPQLPYETLSMPAQPLENVPLGGLQLGIEPRSAEVYVDGIYAGVVSEFSGYLQPLEIAAGPHLVTFLDPAYDPLTISVMIVPGRTVTWRATLTRAYGR